MTRWSFNNALAQKHTPFGQSRNTIDQLPQILPKQNTDFLHLFTEPIF